MRIQRKVEKVFVPVEVILEIRAEVRSFRYLIDYARCRGGWSAETTQLIEDFMEITRGMIEKDA